MLSAFFKQEASCNTAYPLITSEQWAKREAALSLIGSAQLLDDFKRLRDSLEAAFARDEDDPPLEIRREFAGLFLRRGGVNPYESVYLGQEGRLMEKPWLDVRRFYHQHGLHLSSSEDHPEDHISVELGFLALTSFLAAEASESERGDYVLAQLEFVKKHMSKWLPDLVRDIVNDRWANIYAEIARCCLHYVQADRQMMEMVTERRVDG